MNAISSRLKILSIKPRKRIFLFFIKELIFNTRYDKNNYKKVLENYFEYLRSLINIKKIILKINFLFNN